MKKQALHGCRRRCLAVSAVWILAFLAGTRLFAANGFSGVEAVFRDGVIDLRENPQLRRKGLDGRAAGFYTPADLVVGSIFLDTDGSARKVTSIHESDGDTVIETEQPKLEEVYWELSIPDQTLPVTRDNIDPMSVQDYVTVLDGRAETAAAVAAVRAGGRARSTAAPRSLIPSDATWLETDPQWRGANVLAIKINFGKTFGEKPDEKDPEKGEGGVTGTGGGKPETSASATAGVKIQGVLRLAEPVFKAGIKMPVLHFTWVKVWWIVGYPRITHEMGYAHASFDAAQQCDFTFETSVKLTGSVDIPLYAITAIEPNTQLKVTVGLVLRISITGEVTLGFEVSEYTTVGVWGTCDLIWPIFPTNARIGGDHYENVIVRPYIDASVEVRTGPYLIFDLSIAGIKLLGAEIGGGLYARAEGYLEAMSVVGYNTNAGTFGDWNHWRYDISFELGTYLEANLTILIWDLPLFEYKWPFLRLEGSGEL